MIYGVQEMQAALPDFGEVMFSLLKSSWCFFALTQESIILMCQIPILVLFCFPKFSTISIKAQRLNREGEVYIKFVEVNLLSREILLLSQFEFTKNGEVVFSGMVELNE
ncbi:hypothetical protein PIB30_024922 [Stylosanthes scabra]|uniref:Uncharacterized protein n=1 Tax=Stylosanthes scabra TaxID=79078 RepID=A0ABU6TAR0_9FABA|nr:hypothetical protein [Stylosanthes scabra]